MAVFPSAAWCQGPAVTLRSAPTDPRGAGSIQAPEHSNLFRATALSQHVVGRAVVGRLCQAGRSVWRSGESARLRRPLIETLNKAPPVQAETRWPHQHAGSISTVREPCRSLGGPVVDPARPRGRLDLPCPPLPPPHTVVVPVQKLSPFRASSRVACPLSTLPEHLSFLGSQAGGSVASRGSSGLSWWPRWAVRANENWVLGCLPRSSGQVQLWGHSEVTWRGRSRQESGQVTLLPWASV